MDLFKSIGLRSSSKKLTRDEKKEILNIYSKSISEDFFTLSNETLVSLINVSKKKSIKKYSWIS
jgi:hypothetical protein